MKALALKRLARWLTRLYPRWWRARYGQEFDALLEDANLTLLDVFGVVRSALEMRMKSTPTPRHRGSCEPRHSKRIRAGDCRGVPEREDGSKMLVRGFHRRNRLWATPI